MGRVKELTELRPFVLGKNEERDAEGGAEPSGEELLGVMGRSEDDANAVLSWEEEREVTSEMFRDERGVPSLDDGPGASLCERAWDRD